MHSKDVKGGAREEKNEVDDARGGLEEDAQRSTGGAGATATTGGSGVGIVEANGDYELQMGHTTVDTARGGKVTRPTGRVQRSTGGAAEVAMAGEFAATMEEWRDTELKGQLMAMREALSLELSRVNLSTCAQWFGVCSDRHNP